MTDVGSYPNGASVYGVHDMAGNVWEWVADWYDMHYYKEKIRDNPKGPKSGKFKVVRGRIVGELRGYPAQRIPTLEPS